MLEGVEEGWGLPWPLGGALTAGRTCAAQRTASVGVALAGNWGLHLEETECLTDTFKGGWGQWKGG